MKRIILPLSLFATVLTAQAQQRVPLFEIFTSSTCPPCKTGNAVYEGVIAGKDPSEYVGIKYQQNFPGTGDPYCTTEAVNRRSSYYAINSIPRMEIDGAWDKNAASFTAALYNSARAVPAKFSLTGTYYITGKTVSIKLKYSPLVTPVGAKLYVAIVEDTTDKNVKSNGETIFYKVVKKMLPTETGTTLPTIAIGSFDSTSMSFTFAGSYRLPIDGAVANRINNATEHSVEDFKNLKVVAWIQSSSKEVYQAANLTYGFPTSIANVSNVVTAINVFPNPAQDMLSINLNLNNNDQISAKLINMNGATVVTKSVQLSSGKNQIDIETGALPNGHYNLVILDSKNNATGQVISIIH